MLFKKLAQVGPPVLLVKVNEEFFMLFNEPWDLDHFQQLVGEAAGVALLAPTSGVEELARVLS